MNHKQLVLALFTLVLLDTPYYGERKWKRRSNGSGGRNKHPDGGRTWNRSGHHPAWYQLPGWVRTFRPSRSLADPAGGNSG